MLLPFYRENNKLENPFLWFIYIWKEPKLNQTLNYEKSISIMEIWRDAWFGAGGEVSVSSGKL